MSVYYYYMAWKDLPLEERVQKSWEQLDRAVEVQDITLLIKYSNILLNCLRTPNGEKKDTASE